MQTMRNSQQLPINHAQETMFQTIHRAKQKHTLDSTPPTRTTQFGTTTDHMAAGLNGWAVQRQKQQVTQRGMSP